MKKTVFFGLLVTLLVFGFVNCDTDTSNGNYSNGQNTPFEGTWISDRYPLSTEKLIFVGNTILSTDHTGDRLKVTFTFTQTEINFKVTDVYTDIDATVGDQFVMGYVLSENKLTIDQGEGNFLYYTRE